MQSAALLARAMSYINCREEFVVLLAADIGLFGLPHLFDQLTQQRKLCSHLIVLAGQAGQRIAPGRYLLLGFTAVLRERAEFLFERFSANLHGGPPYCGDKNAVSALKLQEQIPDFFTLHQKKSVARAHEYSLLRL